MTQYRIQKSTGKVVADRSTVCPSIFEFCTSERAGCLTTTTADDEPNVWHCLPACESAQGVALANERQRNKTFRNWQKMDVAPMKFAEQFGSWVREIENDK